MIIGGRNENSARLDRHLVLDLGHDECRSLLQERAQQVIGFTVSVLYDDSGHAKIRRQFAHQLAQRVETSPGRADDHNRICHA